MHDMNKSAFMRVGIVALGGVFILSCVSIFGIGLINTAFRILLIVTFSVTGITTLGAALLELRDQNKNAPFALLFSIFAVSVVMIWTLIQQIMIVDQ